MNDNEGQQSLINLPGSGTGLDRAGASWDGASTSHDVMDMLLNMEATTIPMGAMNPCGVGCFINHYYKGEQPE